MKVQVCIKHSLKSNPGITEIWNLYTNTDNETTPS